MATPPHSGGGASRTGRWVLSLARASFNCHRQPGASLLLEPHQPLYAPVSLLKLAFFALWRTAPTAPCSVPARATPRLHSSLPAPGSPSDWRHTSSLPGASGGLPHTLPEQLRCSWRKTRVLPYCTSCKPHWHQLFGLHNDQHVVSQPACEAVVQVQMTVKQDCGMVCCKLASAAQALRKR